MKRALFILFTLIPVSAFAQDRELEIKIVNEKGKPVKSVRAELMNTKKSKAVSDKKGVLKIKNVPGKDSVIVTYPGSSYSYIFSIEGIKELHLNTSNEEAIAYNPIEKEWIYGREKRIPRGGELDIESAIKSGATTLEDIFRKMPQFIIVDGVLEYRNVMDYTYENHTPPLIVVDNLAITGGLREANFTVDINTIESITLQKDGTIWGKDAGNGVVIIKTKKDKK